MADSIKKLSEENELLTEAKDMELGDEVGASIAITFIGGLTVAAASAGLGSAIASKKCDCGVAWSISAECRKSHKPC